MKNKQHWVMTAVIFGVGWLLMEAIIFVVIAIALVFHLSTPHIDVGTELYGGIPLIIINVWGIWALYWINKHVKMTINW